MESTPKLGAYDENLDKSGSEVSEHEEVTEEEVNNRKIIADVLGIEADSSQVDITLSALHEINAGKIQSAERVEDAGAKSVQVFNLVAEDGTNYQVWLKGTMLFGVLNLDTNEWPIASDL